MPDQIPTIGRIVHYRLTAEDADLINARRQRVYHANALGIVGTPFGTVNVDQGNLAVAGDVFPMVIVKACGNNPTAAVNGQVFLDGNDTLWITSVCVGEGPRTFSWPARA